MATTEAAHIALEGAVWCLAASLFFVCRLAACACSHAREAESKANLREKELSAQLRQAQEAAAHYL